jgi:hypothetical protein
MQTEKAGRTGRRFLMRWLAAAVLVGIYCLSTVSIVMTTGLASAQARGRGGSRGFSRGVSRGFVRGRGRRFVRGRGVGIYYDDGCWWSPRYRRWVCPYY